MDVREQEKDSNSQNVNTIYYLYKKLLHKSKSFLIFFIDFN